MLKAENMLQNQKQIKKMMNSWQEMEWKPTSVVKSTVVLEKNHLAMKVYNFLPDFHQLLLGTPRDGFSDSILQVLQIHRFMSMKLSKPSQFP